MNRPLHHLPCLSHEDEQQLLTILFQISLSLSLCDYVAAMFCDSHVIPLENE
jgi:hypothetical protein